MSRPNTLIDFPTVSSAVIANIRQGLTQKDAAEKAGISDRTVRYWVTRGREEDDRLRENAKARPRKSHIPYRTFYLEMEKAKAETKGKLISGWYKSATEEYRFKETTTMTVFDKDGNLVGTTVKEVDRLVPPDWKSMRDLLQNRYGMVPTSRVMVNMEDLTDEELERVANGENPITVISERLSGQGAGSSGEAT